MSEKRDLLASHSARATFKGIKHFPCRFRTALCPNECGHAKDAAAFDITSYHSLEQHGTHKGEEDKHYHLTMTGAPASQQQFVSVAQSLAEGDVVDIAWVHEYVTKDGSSFPERPMTKLEKVVA